MSASEAAAPPLTERIQTALAELRHARSAGDLSREITWQSMMDRLLDRYAAGQR